MMTDVGQYCPIAHPSSPERDQTFLTCLANYEGRPVQRVGHVVLTRFQA